MSGTNSITTNQAARYRITVAGTEVSQSDPKGLEYVSIEDHVDMVGVAELTFAGARGMTWGSLEIGADVEIGVGGGPNMFVGFITGLRHSYQKGRDTITILAMDPLCKLAASRVVKVFEEMTDSDVASSVISDGGCTAGAVDSTPEPHAYIFQRNESNLGFLRRLAARNGFQVRANEGKVDFCKPQFGGSGTPIKKADLIALDYSFTTRNVPTSVTTYGWDYLTKEKVEGTASSGDINAIGGGQNSVAGGGQIWAGESYISDVWVNTQAGAKEMAVGELNRLARNFLRGRAVVQGNGALHAGGSATFEGHRTGFNPEVYIISARHRVHLKAGFTTEIVFCSNTFPTGGG